MIARLLLAVVLVMSVGVTAAADGILLRYKYKDSDTWQLAQHGTLHMHTDLSIGSQSKNPRAKAPPDANVDVVMTGTISTRVTSPDLAMLTVAHLHGTANGARVPERLPEIHVTIDTRGRTTDVSMPGLTGLQGSFAGGCELPESPVQVGGSWRSSARFATADDVARFDFPVTVTATLTRYYKQVADIDFTFQGHVEDQQSTRRDGVVLISSMTVDGHGTVGLDTVTGQWLETDYSWHSKRVSHRIQADSGNIVTTTTDCTAQTSNQGARAPMPATKP